MYIYGLFDDIGELRYVGQTVQSLKTRLTAHTSPCKLLGQTHHNSWIKQLRRYGIRPRIQVIQRLDLPATQADLDAAEVYWIKFFRDQGCRLTNGQLGGAGNSGWKDSEQTRARKSLAMLGKLKTPEHRAKLRQAQTGKKLPAAVRAAMSAAATGKPKSDSHRESMRRAWVLRRSEA